MHSVILIFAMVALVALLLYTAYALPPWRKWPFVGTFGVAGLALAWAAVAEPQPAGERNCASLWPLWHLPWRQ